MIDEYLPLPHREPAQDELGDGLDDVAMDGALQLPGAVFRAGAVFDEKTVGGGAQSELESRRAKAVAEEIVERFKLELEDLLNGGGIEGMVGERAVDAVDELREKRRRTALRPIAWRRAGSAGVSRLAAKPIRSVSSRDISLAPRLEVRKMRDRSKLTVELSPSLSVALSSTPSRRRPSERAAFSTSSKRTMETAERSLWTALSFCWLIMGCVSRWPR